MLKKSLVALLGSVVTAGALAMYAIAGHEAPVSTYTGCVNKSSGKLHSLASGELPLSPCGDNESLIHLSGGDITSVTAGTGLTGGATNGNASLDLAPGFRLPQSCAEGQIPKADGAGAWACANSPALRLQEETAGPFTVCPVSDVTCPEWAENATARFVFARAGCPAGTSLVGGGYELTGNVDLYESHQYDQRTWEVQVLGEIIGNGAGSVRVYARCASIG